MRDEGMPVEETSLTSEDILQAQEVFLTNAAYGIRWVKSVGESQYTNRFSTLLFKRSIQKEI